MFIATEAGSLKHFISVYNGVSIIPEPVWSNPDAVISCDACLAGAGGWFNGKYFHTEFPKFIKDMGLHINALELLTVMVALKLWGRFLPAKKIVVCCDNLSSVVVTQTGRARDKFLQSCLRELVFIQARFSFEVKLTHIRGEDNRSADLLSRWGLDDKFRREFFDRHKSQIIQETFVYEGLFRFSHDW